MRETIAFSGSVYSPDIADTSVGFDLKINDKMVGSSLIHTKQARGEPAPALHHATVPTMVDYDIPFIVVGSKVQPVTIEMVPHNLDSMSDKNDHFNVTIFK